MVVSEQIIQVLDNLCMKLGLAIDWTSENVAPYLTVLCTKLVSYEIWTSVAWLVFATIPLIIVISFTVKYRSTIKETICDDLVGPLIFIGYLIFGAICIAGIIYLYIY